MMNNLGINFTVENIRGGGEYGDDWHNAGTIENKQNVFDDFHAWKTDDGDPDNPEDFEYIIKYSPLHNVKGQKTSPEVLLKTADNNDRFSTLHSYKFISELQY